jgi:hypothetical protein
MYTVYIYVILYNYMSTIGICIFIYMIIIYSIYMARYKKIVILFNHPSHQTKCSNPLVT